MNWAQLKTILWLRWRLTRNQWTRTKGLGAAVAILVTIVLTTLAVTSFGGSFAAGVFLLRDAGPDVIGWIWLGLTLGFFMLWLISLVSELQRSETIDLQRLMHLPVALGQMFTFNYVVSHFTFSIFLFVPAMLGLSVGLAVTHG